MGEIRVGPGMQRVLLLVFALFVAAGVSTQLPELKRYMKVRQM